ncbi:hypothetical protein [Aquimarina sediminis]|uniref:hypothetical protein n=1 Tax=Aquimarina sediminis TaxID=2070536 RepID=UPI000FFE97FB|nr:hypothetical protein [Aquimarina sediminis]
MNLKRIIIFCISLVFLISCKSKGDSNKKNQNGESHTGVPELSVIRGKVIDSKKQKIAYAAVKLYLDEDDCMSAYTDVDGFFELTVDQLRVKDQSHFEVVFKGYAINMLSLRNFTEDKPIILTKKGKIVSVADYRIFYESIKKCANK